MASLTLGLAPFIPEPHIVGKLRWVAGGAVDMQLMDWLDLVLHGTPWLLFIRSLIIRIPFYQKARSKDLNTKIVLAISFIIAINSCQEQQLAPETERTAQHQTLHSDWTYTGDSSPEHWAELDPEYIKCAEGLHQSPIDIETHLATKLSAQLDFNYHSTPINIVNNGHTVQAVPDEDNTMGALGRIWHLKQIHFHDPSEHHIDGIIYPMEVHMVHSDSLGKLAVVAIMVKEGPQNAYLQTIWDAMPDEVGKEIHPRQKLEMTKLIPGYGTVYHYQGSLTTPPCTEGVEWFILAQPMTMSKDQIAYFRRIHPGNNRPLQDHVEKVDVLN